MTLGDIAPLEHLDLSGNSLRGKKEVVESCRASCNSPPWCLKISSTTSSFFFHLLNRWSLFFRLGEIPATIGALKHLTVFNLRGTTVTGETQLAHRIFPH